jgi:dihydrodipicolinate synthase/N-acetylneuraminate lyase
MRHGAAGAVSALASAFPELVAAALRDPSSERSDQLGELRAALDRFPRHAALKRILAVRDVAIGEAVRPPLRGLTDEEREAVDVLAETWLSKTRGPGHGAA